MEQPKLTMIDSASKLMEPLLNYYQPQIQLAAVMKIIAIQMVAMEDKLV